MIWTLSILLTTLVLSEYLRPKARVEPRSLAEEQSDPYSSLYNAVPVCDYCKQSIERDAIRCDGCGAWQS